MRAELAAEVDRIAAEVGLSGYVRIDIGGATVHDRGYGLAHRGLGVANGPATRFGIASGTKGFTALTVMALVDAGRLALDTPARSLLGTDLPLIDGRVTVEHLLCHRSGMGDYFDEEVLDEENGYVLRVPPHVLATTGDYVAVLDGFPMVAEPGAEFRYNNSGYVVLALLAERATGEPFAELVDRLVGRPAGLTATAFLRSDELPGDAALGYLAADGLRTNVLHLPVRGSGDGGLYTTAADVHRLWEALVGGRVVAPATFADMTRDRSPGSGYGLGFWLDQGPGVVSLHGFDAGVGFVSDHSSRWTFSVCSNATRGAWPVAERIRALLRAGR